MIVVGVFHVYYIRELVLNLHHKLSAFQVDSPKLRFDTDWAALQWNIEQHQGHNIDRLTLCSAKAETRAWRVLTPSPWIEVRRLWAFSARFCLFSLFSIQCIRQAPETRTAPDPWPENSMATWLRRTSQTISMSNETVRQCVYLYKYKQIYIHDMSIM